MPAAQIVHVVVISRGPKTIATLEDEENKNWLMIEFWWLD